MKQPKNSRITLGPAEIEAMVRKGAAQVGRGALVVNIPENDLSYVPRDGIIGHLRYLDDAPTVDQLAELIDSTDPNHTAPRPARRNASRGAGQRGQRPTRE